MELTDIGTFLVGVVEMKSWGTGAHEVHIMLVVKHAAVGTLPIVELTCVDHTCVK